MRLFFVFAAIFSVSACSNKTAYVLAQEASTTKCMDRSNDREKLDCRDDHVSYEDYEQTRKEAVAEEDESMVGLNESDREALERTEKELEKIKVEQRSEIADPSR